MNVGELFVKLGIQVDQEKINKFDQGIKNAASSVRNMAIGFSAAIYGLDRFVNGTIQGVAALQNINEQTGLSIELLQKWQKAGQLSNLALSADNIAASIANLQKNLTDLSLGQGNVGGFLALGIDTYGKNAFNILEELRDRISNYSPNVASNLLSQIGIDPAFISILKLSREEFDRLGKNNFLNEKGRNAILATGKALREIKIRFSELKDQIALQVAPTLLKIINSVFKWFISNKVAIFSAITAISKAISSVVSAVSNALSLIKEFTSGIFGSQKSISSFGLAISGLIVILNPFLRKLFLIVSVLDDIKTWRLGGESLFGGFYEKVDKLVKSLSLLKDKMFEIGKSIRDAFSFPKPIIDIFNKIADFAENIVKAAAIGAAGGSIFGIGGAVAGGVGAGAITAGYTAGEQAISPLVNMINSVLDKREERKLQALEKQVNNIEVNVVSSGDARQDGKTIGREINAAMALTGNGLR